MGGIMSGEHRNGNVTGNGTRTEQALRASELSYRRLFEAAQDGILILDVNTGHINDANPFLVKLLGFPRSEMVGKTVGELSPFKDLVSNQAMLERLQKDGYVRYHDLPLETKGGLKIAVEFVSNVYPVGDKKVIQCNIRDIRARKSFDGKMRQLSQAVEQSPASVVITNTQGTIEYVNRKFTEVTGYSLAEVVGKNPSILKSGECPPATYREMWTRITGGGTWSGEFHNRKKNGELYWEWTSISPVLDASGKTTHFLAVKEDITERKQAEESNVRLAEIVETSDDAIVGEDLNNIVTSWNKGAEKIFGHTASDIVGVSVLRYVPADQREEQNHILEKIKRGESVGHFETVRQTKDGRLMEVSVTASPIKDATGKVIGISKILRDITRRKQMEAALRENEEELRVMFELASVGIAQADPRTGQWLRVNRKMCEITGYSAGELLQLHVLDITHPEDRQPDREAFERVVRGESPDYHMEKRYIRKDGTPVWVNVNMTIIRDAAGQPTRTVAAIEDITGRKKAEEQLKLFRLLIERSNDAIEVVDSATGRFLDVNESGCRTPGYTRDEMLSLTVFDLTPEVNRALFAATNAQIKKAGHAMLETLRRRKDGTTYPVEVSLSSVTLDREYAVAIVRDITERRKMEAQFIEAQKMEAVGQLAGGVAHDFNNILAVIMGYNNLIQEDLEPDSPLRKYTDEVQHSADRATGLTRQLLIFSRKQKVQPVVLDLNDAVKDLDKMLRRLVDEHIEMEFVPGKQTGRIKADPGYIWQVLMNLVVNARDAMPNGGKLTIATKNVMLDGDYSPCGVSGGTSPEQVHPMRLPPLSHGAGSSTPPGKRTHAGVIPGNYVMMSVGDTGTGMTDEVKARIFEAFFTTKPEGKGTGLGLATCQAIVQQSGGHIDVDSSVGRGTTFKIYFPQVDEPLDTDAKFIKAWPLPRGTETLLIVEDEPEVRHLAQRLLEAQGYTVLRAVNGQDALHVAREHKGPPIRLVVTDVIMPRMGGKMMTEWLKTTYPDLKILFTSGYTDEAMAQHGVIKTGIDFLAKPFTPAALVRKVRELLDQPNAPTANPAQKTFRFTKSQMG
jgi:PAS domain S-box-containing protein